jgi:hypothetical protein
MSVITSLLLSACVGLTPAGHAGAPIRVTAGVGAFQATPEATSFPIQLAVTVTDAKQDPVPGVPVTFSAPPRGPSGHFESERRPHRVEVDTDACGIAVAPAFVANDEQGGYVVTATVAHVRPAAFALVNAVPGQQP